MYGVKTYSSESSEMHGGSNTQRGKLSVSLRSL